MCFKKTLLVSNVLETLQNLAKYHRKELSIPIIGITGTNGKSTTAKILHEVMGIHYGKKYFKKLL